MRFLRLAVSGGLFLLCLAALGYYLYQKTLLVSRLSESSSPSLISRTLPESEAAAPIAPPQVLTGQVLVRLSVKDAEAIRVALGDTTQTVSPIQTYVPGEGVAAPVIPDEPTEAAALAVAADSPLQDIGTKVFDIAPIAAPTEAQEQPSPTAGPPGVQQEESPLDQWFVLTVDQKPLEVSVASTETLAPVVPTVDLDPNSAGGSLADPLTVNGAGSNEVLVHDARVALAKTKAVIERLKAAGVEEVEPLVLVQTAQTTNDTFFSSKGSWGQAYDDLWGIKTVAAPQAWNTTKGQGVVVAVIDTGVDYDHEDIRNAIWTNPRESGQDAQGRSKQSNGVDDDANGYIDDWRGWNFAGNNNNPFDDNGHGTHVSGTIAATGDNGIGVVGIAPQAQILPVKALDQSGGGRVDTLARAVRYAASMGVTVTNSSWGAAGESQLLQDAFAYAKNRNVVNIVAAGNSSVSARGYIPAQYSSVIAVAALTAEGKRASFSNFGSDVDIIAPGHDILSLRARNAYVDDCSKRCVPAQPSAKYVRLSGTSMATPHVAGIAALIRAHHPEYSAAEVSAVLKGGVEPFEGDQYVGLGIASARRAVAMSAPPPVALVEQVPAEVADVIGLRGSVVGRGATSYDIQVGAGIYPKTWQTVRSGTGSVTGASLMADFTTHRFPDGVQTIRLLVRDANGQSEDRTIALFNNVELLSPTGNDSVSGQGSVSIQGFIGGTAESYVLEYGEGSAPTTWQRQGMTAVAGQRPILAQWDTTQLPPNRLYSLRLVVRYPGGLESKDEAAGVFVDSRIAAGWPHRQAVGDCYVFYQYSPFTVADLDADGQQETIAIIDECHNTAVRYDDQFKSTLKVIDPSGRVRWSKNIPGGSRARHEAPVVADLNGDGALEIYVISEFTWRMDKNLGETSVRAYSATGQALPGWPVTARGSGIEIMAADILPGSGSELVVRSTDGQVESLQVFNAQGQRQAQRVEQTEANPPFQGMALAAVDTNSNGQLEIATKMQRDQVVVLEGVNLTQLWQARIGMPADKHEITYIVAGDINGTVGDELVVTSLPERQQYNSVYAFSSAGQVLPGWPQQLERVLSLPPQPILVQFDKDREVEIAVPAVQPATDPKKVILRQHVWQHTGAAVSGWPKELSMDISTPNWSAPQSNIIADVTGDGVGELIVSFGGLQSGVVTNGDLTKSGGMWAWDQAGQLVDLNGSAPSMPLFQQMTTILGSSFKFIMPYFTPTVSDLDADGRLDIISSSGLDAGWERMGGAYRWKGTSSIYRWELSTANAATGWTRYQADAQQTNRVTVAGSTTPLPATPTPTSTPTPTPSNPPPITCPAHAPWYDVTGDGRVTRGDREAVSAGLATGARDVGTGAAWQNQRNIYDVNDDGSVTPVDILVLTNYLNQTEAGILPVCNTPTPSPTSTPTPTPTVTPTPTPTPIPTPTVTPTPLPSPTPRVVGRYIRYNNSVYDGYSEGIGSRESMAVAQGKAALLPGGHAQFAHYISTPQGITGLVIDVGSLPILTALSAQDFEFKMGTAEAIDQWVVAPSPADIVVQAKAGNNAADRIFITWPAGSIVNQWLRVTLKATTTTGLSMPDVFYVGHLMGDVGVTADHAQVTDLDSSAIYDHRSETASITSPYDINRDGKVTFIDAYLSWQQRGLTLPLIRPN